MNKINVSELLRKNALASVMLKNKHDTEKLGRDFAPCLYVDWEKVSCETPRTRLGLLATPGTGKSALVQGIFSVIATPLNFDRRKDFLRLARFEGKCITQKWCHSFEMGDICHVDAGFGSEFWRILQPYRDRLLEKSNRVGIDIVENAEYDSRFFDFDAAIWIEKQFDSNGGQCRQAYIYASDGFTENPSFQKFLDEQDLVDPFESYPSELAELNP